MAWEMAFPIVLILTLFISAFIVLTKHQAHMKAQRNLPDRSDYLAAVGNDRACKKCGATETAEHGLNGGEDNVRIVTCASCQALLYQFKREQTAD
ncbi:hypothetical protein [Denitromonas halophila]|uniref:Uncharacterized protein n=1 Tax=Denitromonas halophila TaxID=1629404 RepID=A0A557R2I0_9RHOO|nr:hypothetical protein [Denitromonas halophila]TVO59371.1 hypothetical protein FHP91_01250 [Denitromonas halophila]